ncbi:MAG: hypothetical protein GY761_18465 [Hyphomicrobiales bacterium]|nr:hypothetical protein [Hyphomicrobiales bacterium]
MAMKIFTFYSLGRNLDNVAPGFGMTVDYDILEGLIRSINPQQPPSHLRDEFKQLAEEHDCDFHDWHEHRFIHFVKRGR